MDNHESRAEAARIWAQYDEGLTYQREMGFTQNWPEYERFKAGDQWPAPTERTRNLPRPVFNLIRYIEDHKVSSVMNENVKMQFTPQDGTADPGVKELVDQACDQYTRFADATWENIQQDKLNEDMLDTASNTGTGILHYYWDLEPEGGLPGAEWKGELKGEEIDPINIFFGNPQIPSIQKQPYIIISSREMVTTVREQARQNGLSDTELELIQPDKRTTEEGYDPAQHELNKSEKITVLTKYYRQNGAVVFCKSVQGTMVKPETPLGNGSHKLYPLIILTWSKRRKCVFGIGDTESLIPNQKAVNFLYAMHLLGTQLTAWPKLVYKKNSLPTGFRPTNTPGEVIEDQSPTPGQNIYYLNPGTIPNNVMALAENIMNFTRELAGAHEAATGEAPSAQLNASAIMMLQKAAAIPIESIRRRFYRAMEDVGRIWEEFFKGEYNALRMVNVKDDNDEPVSMPFRGADFADIGMKVKIDIGPASTYSETLMMSSLDRFLDKQMITFDDYLKYAPKNVVPFKDRLLKDIQLRAEQQTQMQAMQSPQMDIGAVMANMPPELRARVEQMPPEDQQALLAQVMGGGGPPMQNMGQ